MAGKQSVGLGLLILYGYQAFKEHIEQASGYRDLADDECEMVDPDNQRILPDDSEHLVEPELAIRFRRRADAVHAPIHLPDVRRQPQQLQIQPLQIEPIDIRHTQMVPLRVEPVQIQISDVVKNPGTRTRARRPGRVLRWLSGNGYRRYTGQ